MQPRLATDGDYRQVLPPGCNIPFIEIVWTPKPHISKVFVLDLSR